MSKLRVFKWQNIPPLQEQIQLIISCKFSQNCTSIFVVGMCAISLLVIALRIIHPLAVDILSCIYCLEWPELMVCQAAYYHLLGYRVCYGAWPAMGFARVRIPVSNIWCRYDTWLLYLRDFLFWYICTFHINSVRYRWHRNRLAVIMYTSYRYNLYSYRIFN